MAHSLSSTQTRHPAPLITGWCSINRVLMYYYCRVLFLSVVCAGSLLTQVRAADVAVSVRDNYFDPFNVTINVNDRVVWTWTGRNLHDTTGPGNPPLWRSPIQSNG